MNDDNTKSSPSSQPTDDAPDSAAASAKATPPFPKDAKLSEQLNYLHEMLGGRPMQIRDMITILGDHAPLLLIILLVLPCAIPLPIPLSTPFGFAIVIIALSLVRKTKPQFSERILNARLPAGVSGKLVAFSRRVMGWIEHWMRIGRAQWVLPSHTWDRVHAVGLILSGLYLLLPLPVPFSNTFPAWAILLVASGLLGRDGLLVILGHITLVAGVFYLVFLGGVTAAALNALKDWVVGLFA